MLDRWLSEDVVHLVFDFLTLSGRGGAISLSCTCKTMRKMVLEYDGFNDFALTAEDGADACAIQRAKSFPASAKRYARVQQGKFSTEALHECEYLRIVMSVNAIAVFSALPNLARLRVLDCGDCDLGPSVAMLTTENFPNLKELRIRQGDIVRTLPKGVSSLEIHYYAHEDFELDMGEIFPNLESIIFLNSYFGNRYLRLLTTLPPSLKTLRIKSDYEAGLIPALVCLQQLTSLVRFEASLSTPEIEAILSSLPSPCGLKELRLYNADYPHSSPGLIYSGRIFPWKSRVTDLELAAPLVAKEWDVFKGADSCRRLRLSVVSDGIGGDSIFSYVFRDLPALTDFRVTIGRVQNDEWLRELIHHSKPRPEVRVAVFEGAWHSESQSILRIAEYDVWPNLWYYIGNGIPFLCSKLQLPNLLHISIAGIEHVHLLMANAPTKLRTLDLSTGRDRSVMALAQEMDRYFEKIPSLDVIEIDRRGAFYETSRELCQIQNTEHARLRLRSDSRGELLTMFRKQEGRELTGRAPPSWISGGERRSWTIPRNRWA